MRVIRRMQFVIDGGWRVYQVAEIPLKPFPGRINSDLVGRAIAEPGLSIEDFLYMYLGNIKHYKRIAHAFERAVGITPKMLCLVDPAEWISVVKGFGEECARALLEAITAYRCVKPHG